MWIRAGLALPIFAVAALSSAQIQSGRLAVVQIGDGAGSLGSTGVATRIIGIDKATGAITAEQINLTFNGTNGIVLTGNTTGEGGFTSTAAGNAGFIGGYGVAVGTGSLSTLATKRVVRFDYTTGALVEQDLAVAGQARGTSSINGTDFSLSTGSAGVVNGTLGSSSFTSASTETNTRFLSHANGVTYFSTSQGGTNLIKEAILGGATLINLGSTVTADFALTSDGLTLYVGSDSATTGGIFRFTRTSSSSSWDAGTRIFTSPIRHLALEEVAGQHNLYGSFRSGATSTVQAFFNTATATSVTAAWTTANPTNTAFLGVDLVVQGVPEPATLTALGLGALALLRKRRSG